MRISKIFITGVTGYIGGSIATLLVSRGYQVKGLVRKESDIDDLKELEIEAVVGSLYDAPLMQRELAHVDAVIHTAQAAEDPYPVDTFLEALRDTGKTFLFTSGSAILGGKDGGERSEIVYREDSPLEPRFEMAERVVVNNHVLNAASYGVRSIVIVPTMVYGAGLGLKKESIQLPALWKISTDKGAGVYIARGENIWSNVHIADLAQLYVDALEKAAAGSYFYAENGEASLKEIAKSISKKMGVEQAVSITMQEAVNIFGPAGAYFGLASNSRCSAEKARDVLGWQPKYSSIIDYIGKFSV